MAEVKEIDWGGNAFPTEGGDGSGVYPDPGMSLRDWFAGQALSGITAGLCSGASVGDRAFDRLAFCHAAQDAYMLADAMIAARKGGV
jgi:hypothetical protein